MARGENPGDVLSFKAHSSLANAYDKDSNFGHPSAGQDLALSLDGTNHLPRLGVDGQKFAGKFMDLGQDGELSAMVTGVPMILRSSADAVTPGRGVVCAGNGQVKTPTNTAETANERGLVIEVLSTGANGRIKVIMPA